ncbi:MAG: antibiotic biosynthesis monooxygenase [Crocinitomicaceae bacterium]|nr:antibiotic biosynthesis monooxygenase [Crocinitomicaceae bacterium]|tara:strand:- start:8229 stop:8525 length:297 start_codon:yes stop_codon:yes gene_type:complete
MFIRIVKMTFKKDKTEEFRAIFNASKNKIRNQPGCQHLELLRDVNSPNIFMTYSYWTDSKDLENYRKSELFGQVWKATKALFDDKPQAWSVNREWISN